MTSTLRIPVVISGGLAAAEKRIGPQEPLSGAVRLPDQAENVDFAPDRGLAAGPASRRRRASTGRVLSEAFPRRPAPVCAQAAAGPAPVAGPGAPTGERPQPAPADGRLPATGWTGGVALAALTAAASGLLVWRRRRAVSLPPRSPYAP
jgi:hypothetical protein